MLEEVLLKWRIANSCNLILIGAGCDDDLLIRISDQLLCNNNYHKILFLIIFFVFTWTIMIDPSTSIATTFVIQIIHFALCHTHSGKQSHSNLSNIFCLKKIEFAEEEVILCLKKVEVSEGECGISMHHARLRSQYVTALTASWLTAAASLISLLAVLIMLLLEASAQTRPGPPRLTPAGYPWLWSTATPWAQWAAWTASWLTGQVDNFVQQYVQDITWWAVNLKQKWLELIWSFSFGHCLLPHPLLAATPP